MTVAKFLLVVLFVVVVVVVVCTVGWVLVMFLVNNNINKIGSAKIKDISLLKKNKKKELVVIICSEDFYWILDVAKDYDLVTVYSKCKDLNISYSFLENNDKIKLIHLPNIGSCDYGFLTYVIDRYDSLPDYVHFAKGNGPPQNYEFLKCAACVFSNNKEFNDLMNFKLNFWKFSNNIQVSVDSEWVASGFINFQNWIDHQPFLSKLMYQQNYCNIQYGGRFGASKKQIQNTPKNVFIDIKNQQKHKCEEIDHFIERTWRILLCRPIYLLVVVASFKNKAAVMREWLTNYTGQGVQHFYLVDNGSTDNWRLETKGFPVTIKHSDSDDQLYNIYQSYNKNFLKKVKQKSYYVMVTDVENIIFSEKKLVELIGDDPKTDVFNIKSKTGHKLQILKTNRLQKFNFKSHNYAGHVVQKKIYN